MLTFLLCIIFLYTILKLSPQKILKIKPWKRSKKNRIRIKNREIKPYLRHIFFRKSSTNFTYPW